MPNYGVSSGAVCITDNCKNVEAALRWVDTFYSETGDLCSQYGADEGTDWVLNPEGKVGLNGEPALYEVLNVYSAEAQNHDWQDVGIRVAPEAYRLGQAVDADVDPMHRKDWKDSCSMPRKNYMSLMGQAAISLT